VWALKRRKPKGGKKRKILRPIGSRRERVTKRVGTGKGKEGYKDSAQGEAIEKGRHSLCKERDGEEK